MQISKKQMQKNFEKNMKFFKKNTNHVYKKLKKYKLQRFQIIHKNGRIDIFDKKERRFLYNFQIEEFAEYQLKNFFNLANIFIYNSQNIYDKNFKALHLKVQRAIEGVFKKYNSYKELSINIPFAFSPILIVAGIGPGLILQKLIEKFFIKKLYVYEPNTDFFYISLFLIDWEKIYSNFEDPQDFILQVGKSNEENIDFKIESQIQFLLARNPVLSSYTNVFRHYKNEDTIKATEKARIFFYRSFSGWGYLEDEKKGFKHSMKNLKRSSKIIFIKDDYNSPKRVFIVGSGPSLDDSIDYIKKYQNSAVIFACGTAINPLVENGIIPDFLIELERGQQINDVLDTIAPQILKQIYLIAPDVIHPNVPNRFKDVFYFIRTSSVAYRLLKPKTKVIGIAPTVTNTALALALTMGIQEIYLFGVDLGFKNEEKVHASGTVYNKKETRFYKKDKFKKHFSFQGNFGGIVHTTRILSWAKRTMEETIYYHRNKNIKIYNCSDGVKIHGTIPLMPSDIKCSNIDKEDEIKKILDAFVENIEKTLNIKPFEKILEDIKLFKEEINKIFEKKITNHKEIYYFLESIESFLKEKTNTLEISTFVRGTIRHILRTLYLNMLKLNHPSYIEPAFEESKQIFLKEFNIMMDDIEKFIKKYEKNYKSLYENKLL